MSASVKNGHQTPPTNYWLSTLPEDISFHRLVDIATPQNLVPSRCSRRLLYPTIIDPEEPPLRPERHISNSIATMRRQLAIALALTLQTP